MSFKHFLIHKLSVFFLLTTLITIAVSLLGSVFDAEARYGYDAMLSPLVYAACCIVPTLVTYSKRELKPRELMGRMVLELALIEAMMLCLAFHSTVIDTGRPAVVLAIAGSVFVIYFLARVFSWLADSAEARKLNDELLKFQQIHEK